jgi:hypothetical protein
MKSGPFSHSWSAGRLSALSSRWADNHLHWLSIWLIGRDQYPAFGCERLTATPELVLEQEVVKGSNTNVSLLLLSEVLLHISHHACEAVSECLPAVVMVARCWWP